MHLDCEFPTTNATAAEIREILKACRTIAVVGLSRRPERASHGVARYMLSQGYRIIPINPNYDEILGKRSFPRLSQVGEAIEMVNIFRRPEAVPEIVEEAIAIRAKVIWMQEGVVHNAAAERARRAGLLVVMNKCLQKEHCRAGPMSNAC